jgi:hypothetical protein
MEGAGGLAVAGILAKLRESFFRQDVRRLYVLGFADAWRGWQLENHDVATPPLQRRDYSPRLHPNK